MEEIFAEFNFADFGPIREIIFREIWFFLSLRKEGHKMGERVKMGKVFAWKLLICEIKFRENFFP